MKTIRWLCLTPIFIFLLWAKAQSGPILFYYDASGVLHITNVAPPQKKKGGYSNHYALPLTRLQNVWHLILGASRATGLDPLLLSSLVIVESMCDPDAISPKGAVGLTQLMPGTARELGVDPEDPRENLLGGAWYLRTLLDQFDGDLITALAAYNAGPGIVREKKGVPPYRETRQYVKRVLKTWKQLQKEYPAK